LDAEGGGCAARLAVIEHARAALDGWVGAVHGREDCATCVSFNCQSWELSGEKGRGRVKIQVHCINGPHHPISKGVVRFYCQILRVCLNFEAKLLTGFIQPRNKSLWN
jgi:hypothetical protein